MPLLDKWGNPLPSSLPPEMTPQERGAAYGEPLTEHQKKLKEVQVKIKEMFARKEYKTKKELDNIVERIVKMVAFHMNIAEDKVFVQILPGGNLQVVVPPPIDIPEAI